MTKANPVMKPLSPRPPPSLAEKSKRRLKLKDMLGLSLPSLGGSFDGTQDFCSSNFSNDREDSSLLPGLAAFNESSVTYEDTAVTHTQVTRVGPLSSPCAQPTPSHRPDHLFILLCRTSRIRCSQTCNSPQEPSQQVDRPGSTSTPELSQLNQDFHRHATVRRNPPGESGTQSEHPSDPPGQPNGQAALLGLPLFVRR